MIRKHGRDDEDDAIQRESVANSPSKTKRRKIAEESISTATASEQLPGTETEASSFLLIVPFVSFPSFHALRNAANVVPELARIPSFSFINGTYHVYQAASDETMNSMSTSSGSSDTSSVPSTER